MEETKIDAIEGQIVPLQTLGDFSQVFTKGDVAFTIKTAIMDGNVQPAFAAVAVKRMKEACELVLKDKEVAAVMKADVEKYISNGKAEILGAEVKIQSTYTFYDFSNCGHLEYDRLVEIKKEIEERLKQLEEGLKLQYKEYESKASKVNKLSIPSSSKDYIIESLPVLVREGCGEVVSVQNPVKVQNIGLKFFKI